MAQGARAIPNRKVPRSASALSDNSAETGPNRRFEEPRGIRPPPRRGPDVCGRCCCVRAVWCSRAARGRKVPCPAGGRGTPRPGARPPTHPTPLMTPATCSLCAPKLPPRNQGRLPTASPLGQPQDRFLRLRLLGPSLWVFPTRCSSHPGSSRASASSAACACSSSSRACALSSPSAGHRGPGGARKAAPPPRVLLERELTSVQTHCCLRGSGTHGARVHRCAVRKRSRVQRRPLAPAFHSANVFASLFHLSVA